jgi:hypothetical protein
MLTKRQIAEAIIIQKMGGNPSVTSPIDERDVFAMADMVCAELITQDIQLQLRSSGSFEIDSDWVRQFTNVPVQYDKTLEQTYIDLPASRISLNGDVDLQYVGWQAGGVKFPQETQSAQYSWSLLEAGNTGANNYAYYPIGNRVYFRTLPKRYVGKRLMVRMVAGIDGYGPDDALPVPSGFTAVLMERLGNMFQVQISTKAKNNNDSNSNVRT